MNSNHPYVQEYNLEGANFNAAGEASSSIKQTLQRIGIRSDILRRIAICSYEAEMNVIIHARKGVLRALVYPDRTELEVYDEGPGIADVEQAMREGFSTAPDYIRELGFGAGMGLPNMSRCADKFSIDTVVGAGTKIRMVIYHDPVTE